MRVLLRCAGGGPLGVGHVMRSLALAEAAVAAGHEVVVAGCFEGEFLKRQLSPRNLSPVDLVQLPAVPASEAGPDPIVALVESFGPDVLHVDSYDLSGWLTGSFVLSNMEDGTFGRRPADVVVDPTPGAELSPRPEDGSTWLLRGSRYTPVRQQVIDERRRAADGDEGGLQDVARTVLVVMGGTDPVGLTPIVVELLARTGLTLQVTAIAVGENAVRTAAAARGSALSLTVLAPVDDLAATMAASDLVISAAGTSIWELCCIGVPTAVAWAVDNQRAGYDRVVAAGAAIGLGGPELGHDERAVDLLEAALTDSGVRARLVRSGRQVVDGLGAWRVVRMWEQAVAVRRLPVIRTAGLVARRATLQDSRQLWQWRNDPATRAGSRMSAEVPWEEHLRWFTATLDRTDRLLLVVEGVVDPVDPIDPVENSAVGTVRWDLRSQGQWEVSITVSPNWRGQSLARPLLRAGELALAEQMRAEQTRTGPAPVSGSKVLAYLAVVHIDNVSSMRLFETSGYVPDLPPDQQGFMQFRKAAQVT